MFRDMCACMIRSNTRSTERDEAKGEIPNNSDEFKYLIRILVHLK